MVRIANEKDIYGIYEIIKDAKKLLKESGSDQWQDKDNYPSLDTITSYVRTRSMYVYEENYEIVGCLALCRGIDEAYLEIDGKWLNDDVYFVMHLMAVKNGHYHKGVAKTLIKELSKIAYQENVYNIRIDTKKENIKMTNLLLKMGFVKTGVITLKRDAVIDPLRDAYQLIIDKEMFEDKKEEVNRKKSHPKKMLDFIVKTMNGMAYGLFATLIIGTIIGTIAGMFPSDNFVNAFLMGLSSLLKLLTGVGIGIGIAWSMKLDGLKLISASVAGGVASYFSKIKIWELFGGIGIEEYFKQNTGFTIGDPLSVYLVVIITIILINLILKKKTPVDIIIIPLLTLVISGLISVVICGPVSYITTVIGKFVNEATEYQPLLMGIIISVIMGMALTAPISSAAIAAALNLSGLAGGASVIGCAVQMVGFAVMSRKDNNVGTVLSVGIGTSMLQFKNILKKPIIWLPTIIASAILGPVGIIFFGLKCNSSGAGMGTSGLVGIFGTIEEMGGLQNSWLPILLLLIVLPIILVYIFDVILRKLNIIKKDDLKI
ncbi:MAG: GNAT family N-acetyltransferase [Bacilli bacterium]|nr:GNAT family N-acetyltransferase [Bacilli bacterium]